MAQQSRLSAFVAELRRRRVFRVAAFYGGIAFVIIQIIDGAFDYLHIPEWFGTAIIVLLLIGFPVAMLLAWVFDITEEGIVRTRGRPSDAKRKAQPLIGNRALAIIAVVAIAFGIWGRWGGTGQDSGGPITLAVLPFQNYSEEEGDWFADGFTDIITSQLSKLTDLRVIARTTTMHYKNSELSAGEIAEELGADMVLEGSILRAGGKVLITGQLIDASTDSHIWTESYERQMDDVIALQSDVAISIAQALNRKLTPKDEAALTSLPTDSPEAYDHYLKGLSLINNLYLHPVTTDSATAIRNLAIEQFEQALDIDSTFGDAYYQVVLHHSLFYFGLEETKERLTKATSALSRAERLIPGIPALQKSRGVYAYYAGRDYQKALAELEPLLKSHPNDAELMYRIGLLYRRVGRWDEALELLKRAADLDTRNADVAEDVLQTYRVLHRYAEAERYYERLRFMGATERYATRAWIAVEGYGDLNEAWLILEEGYREVGPGPLDVTILAIAWYRRDHEAMERFLQGTTDLDPWVVSLFRAMASMIEGDTDLGKQHAQQALTYIQTETIAQYSKLRWSSAMAALLGDRERTLEWGDQSLALMNPEKDALDGPYNYAVVGITFVLAGILDRGFDLLEEAMAQPNNFTIHDLKYHPNLDSVRDHPRYLALLEKYGGGR